MRRAGAFLTVVLGLGLGAFACGSSGPAGPSPAAPPVSDGLSSQLAGTWSGFVRLTDCADTQFTTCFLDPLNPFVFTLARDGAGWSGTVEIDMPSRAVVAVQGIEEAHGEVVFRGATMPSTPTSSAATVSALRLRADPAAGLVGDLAYIYRHAGQSNRTVTLAGTIASAARGAVANGPGTPPRQLDGTWLLSAYLDRCTTYSGDPCTGTPWQKPWQETSFTVTIRDSAGGAPRALVEWPSNVVVDLSGARGADGALHFAGSADFPGQIWFRAEVPELVVEPDPDAGLVGRFEYLRHHAPGRNHDGGIAIQAGRVLSAVRREESSFLPGAFQGSWHGDGLVTACLAGDCELLPEGQLRSIRLSLTQAGASVWGSFSAGATPLPLSGKASGVSADLAGEIELTTCHELSMYLYECGQRVEALGIVLDEFGRLSGSLVYTRDGRRAGQPYTYTVRMTLVGVVPD